MSNWTGGCCLCHANGGALSELADAWICDACENLIPWECKTARFCKGVGFENKYAEKYIIKKMRAQQVKEIDAFMQMNHQLTSKFQETGIVYESGMVFDENSKCFYFDIRKAKLSDSLKEALLWSNEPRVIFRAEWISGFRLDYAYYKTLKRDGSALYYPQYAQIVLSFRHPCLVNKSIRLDIDQPALVELMLRKHYENAARTTLEALERLTGLERGAETKTYYEGG